MSLGLTGHESLVGKSALANGDEKYDYLCPVTLTLSGVQQARLVVRVAPDQPNLLGLDALVLFDMDLHPARLEYSIRLARGRARAAAAHEHNIIFESDLVDPPAIPYRWLHFEKMLQQRHITNKDLVPLQLLPPPDESHRMLVSTGKSHFVLDLGSASSTWVRVAQGDAIIDLGWS